MVVDDSTKGIFFVMLISFGGGGESGGKASLGLGWGKVLGAAVLGGGGSYLISG